MVQTALTPTEDQVPQDSPEFPFAPLVNRWKTALNVARKDKQIKFDQWADEAWNFYDGPLNWMWRNTKVTKIAEQRGGTGHVGFLAEDGVLPAFQMSVNRLFEAVAMFGPTLYHQNPTIAVEPRARPDVSIETYYATNPQASQIVSMIPDMEQGIVADDQIMDMAIMLQQQYEQVVGQDEYASDVNSNHAQILEFLANYIQQESNKQDEARMAITEAIVCGLGLFETRWETPPAGGPRIARSRFRTHRDLLVDPDAKYWRDVTWIALRTVAPVNIVSEKYGIDPRYLKGKLARLSAIDGAPKTASRNGDGTKANVVYDLVEYWEIWSKNGAGQNLHHSENDKRVPVAEVFGDYAYMVICPGCPFPLNLSPNILANVQDDMELARLGQWDVPYWDDYMSDGGWPISRLSFYPKPGEVWPISMCKACIGELRFVNWCMSFLADKISAGSRIYVGVMKEAAEEIRSQLTSGQGPYSIIELSKMSGEKVTDIISMLQSPNVNTDIWQMVAAVNDQIDKRLGLTELLYGTSTKQIRSAAEADIRQSNIQIRPDDMASRVEDWLAKSAVREIQAMRFLADYEDVLPILGATAAQVFTTQILTQDVSAITRDFKYRVAAGTARKPNKNTKITQLTQAGQYLLPVIQPLAQAGVTGPYNAYVSDLMEAMELDGEKYLMSPMDAQQLAMMQMGPPPETETESGSE